MPWHAAAASVTGAAHLKSGLPCQDVCAFEVRGELLQGVLSDGAGSAALAHEGAKLAVETAMVELRKLPWTELPYGEHHAMFTRVVGAVKQALDLLALDRQQDSLDYSCTLLAFIASPDWLAALQVGDGLIVARAPGKTNELLFKPDRGEYVNETTFVTSPDAMDRMQAVVWKNTPAFLCVGSDGIERAAVRFSDWTLHPPFFQALDEYIAVQRDPREGAKDIAEFLLREKLQARSDDDKAMILGAYIA